MSNTRIIDAGFLLFADHDGILFNGKPQATVQIPRSRLRFAVKRFQLAAPLSSRHYGVAGGTASAAVLS